MATYYKNATCDMLDKVKSVRLNWAPTVLEDGVDNNDDVDQIGVTNEVLEVEVENRDANSAYTCRGVFVPTNVSWGDIAMTVTMFQATTTSTPKVLVMTAPLWVGMETNEAWGELTMFRSRFRAETWSLT